MRERNPEMDDNGKKNFGMNTMLIQARFMDRPNDYQSLVLDNSSSPIYINMFMVEDLNIRQLEKYWLTASQKDMEAAHEIYENTKNHVTVLFHIHLAIEKSLKALYVQRKAGHAPFTHNLIFLVKSADLEISDTQRKLLTDINEFNIECRYPDEKFSIYKKATRKFTGDYLKKAEKMREWISSILNNK